MSKITLYASLTKEIYFSEGQLMCSIHVSHMRCHACTTCCVLYVSAAGKPKRPNALKSLCLMLGPDFITDVMEVSVLRDRANASRPALFELV